MKVIDLPQAADDPRSHHEADEQRHQPRAERAERDGLEDTEASDVLREWHEEVVDHAGVLMLRSPDLPRRLGPFAAGAAFSLVTTPCASPLVGGVLAASSAQSVPGLAVVSMGAFAVGYTALVFAGGVFGGNLVRRLRQLSFDAPRAAAAALLLLLGFAFTATGVAWF